MSNRNRNCIGYATLSVTSTVVVTLADASPAITSAVHRAIITVEDKNIRWRPDGTDPTTSEGHLAESNDAMQFMDDDYSSLLNNLKMISTSGTALLKISYFN